MRSRTLPRRPWPLAAVLTTLCLQGCGPSARISGFTLPERPAFVQRVVVRHAVGDDLELIAARERAGRARANDIIACFSLWYGQVRDAYGAAGSTQILQDCNKPGANR